MALTKQDLKEIRTIVRDEVTIAIGKNNGASVEMFEAQNEYIDQRFGQQDQRIDEKFAAQDGRISERFVAERAEIRQIIRAELADIRQHVEKLEKLEIADIQAALDEISGLKKRPTTVERLVTKLQLAHARPL